MNITRESIFSSALRTFCKFFAAMLGLLICFVILAVVAVSFSTPYGVPERTSLFISADAEGNRMPLPISSPAILRIKIHGVIGDKYLNTRTIESQLLDSHEAMLKNDRVKGILLDINSPGGSALDSYNIYLQLKNYKAKYNIPIYAFVDGLCASGGMMIACAADKIYANPASMIGSVGVIFGPALNYSGLMEKVGIAQHTFTRGKDKDELSPYRPWKEGEGKLIDSLLDESYALFLEIVSTARPKLTKNKLINEYGAHMFSAGKATELGYVDGSPYTYNQTLEALAAAAKIETKSPYQVVELKVVRSPLADLLDGKSPLLSGKMTHQIDIGLNYPAEFANSPLYLYAPTLDMLSKDG